MGEDWRYETIDFIGLTKNVNIIEKDPPIYVKEGKHSVVIKYYDRKNEDDKTVYDVNFSLLEDSNGIAGFVVSYEDVSKLNGLQEKLSQFENLSAVNEVAATYIHEIKTPYFQLEDFCKFYRKVLVKMTQKRIYRYNDG